MRASFRLLAIAAAAALLATPASAGKIPIPCTGETVVKVLDLDTADIAKAQALKTGKPARKIDLGYKFSGCTGGDWVGYVGSEHTYLALPGEALKLLLIKSGHTGFPPAPSFMGTFRASWVVWMYLVAFTILGIAIYVQNKSGTQTAPAPERGDLEPVAAAPARATVPSQAGTRKAPPMPQVPRRPALPPGAVNTSRAFGRRA